MSTQNTFMNEALQEAKHAFEQGEVPVGAVVVRNNEIIARASNKIITLKDPTAHAEVIAIREAAKSLGNERLIDCDLYVTLEPCAMCAGAISLARVRSVVFGALDSKGGGVIHGPRFFEQETCHHRPHVESGVLAQECGQLLKTFFQNLRQKKRDKI
ncbi:MAG: nucleoside deaminase [Holosporaceae bacterium]|nr:MAG: nucleoside deaminase [Holosporaceae bacterium]